MGKWSGNWHGGITITLETKTKKKKAKAINKALQSQDLENKDVVSTAITYLVLACEQAL